MWNTSSRGNWQSLDAPQISSMSVTEHYDIFPPGVSLTSRKSSSSTDSSCLSIHSRSTTSSSEKGSDSLGGGGVCIFTFVWKWTVLIVNFIRMRYVYIQIYIRCGVGVNIYRSFDCQNLKNHKMKVMRTRRLIKLFFQSQRKQYFVCFVTFHFSALIFSVIQLFTMSKATTKLFHFVFSFQSIFLCIKHSLLLPCNVMCDVIQKEQILWMYCQ